MYSIQNLQGKVSFDIYLNEADKNEQMEVLKGQFAVMRPDSEVQISSVKWGFMVTLLEGATKTTYMVVKQ